MEKKVKKRLRFKAQCKDRAQVVAVSEKLMGYFKSHITVIGMGQRWLTMNLMPLDEEYFDIHESMQFIGMTLREAMPKEVKWKLSFWKKR